MGIFNYIDSFFFISLGITFILILLLVFHFKQRINVIEQKTDTMFEIINNVVKEIVQVKTTLLSCCSLTNNINYSNNIPLKLKENPISINETIYFDNNNENMNSNKIIVSDSSVNSDEDDDDLNSDNEDINSDSDNESESDHTDSESSENESESDNSDDEDDDENHENIVVTNLHNKNISSEEIKLINVQDNQLINDENIVIEKINNENENKNEKENEETNESNKNEKKELLMEMYRKMNIQSLKTFVITKGLTSDPSKMKKVDLLKLIENNLDEI